MKDMSVPCVGKLYRLKSERVFAAQGRMLDKHECVLVLKADLLVDPQDDPHGDRPWVNVLLLFPANGATGATTYNRHKNNVSHEIMLDTGYPPDNTGWGYWFEEVT